MSVNTIPANIYALQLLADKDFITSEDIPMDNDTDYVMLIILTAEYDCQSSAYRLEFLDGSISRNRYIFPNMIIHRKT